MKKLMLLTAQFLTNNKLKERGKTMKKLIFLASVLLFAIQGVYGQGSYIPIQPDANTVLLDRFNNSTLANYVNGTLEYVEGLPGLNQAANFRQGTWVRYALPGWNQFSGTVEMWVYPRRNGINLYWFQWYEANSPPPAGYILYLGINADGKLQFNTWPSLPPGVVPIGNTTIPLNQWSHVVYTWSDNGTRMYVNGIEDFFTQHNCYPAILNPTYLYLNSWGESDLGYVDELHISKVARTAEEIRSRIPGTVQNLNTGLFYSSIQSAIDAPQTLNGHTLIASAGTFTENITINKSVTIRGAGADSTILQASNSGINTVSITANNVTIKKITIRNATGSGVAGIRLSSVTGVQIDSCTITNNYRGIQLVSASNNTISNCNILSNIENGIKFFSSSNGNQIIGNTVANTIGGVGEWSGNGINIGDQSSSSNIITDNIVHNNALAGIIAYAGSNNMQIRRNTVYGNGAGIMLGWSSGCIIENNHVSNNREVGINIDTAPNNIFRNNIVANNGVSGFRMMGLGQTGNLIENNTISNNGYGIEIWRTLNSIIRFNTIEGHSIAIQIFPNSYGNRIYNNNFIGNTTQAIDDSPEADYWDNGLPEGGNHWSNWTAPDTNGDGFVDIPYPISGGYSQDNFPYVRQNGWIPEITTTALRIGVIGRPYSDTLRALGGVQPYTWSIISGALPPGLNLTSQGIIQGTPSTLGTYQFTVEVRDSRTPPFSNSRSFSIPIVDTLQISTTSFKQATAGFIYADTIQITGGALPYRWSVTSGVLPPGLRLDSLSGAVVGLPTTYGTWQFTIRVTDATQQTASRQFQLLVAATDTFTHQIALGDGWGPNIAYDTIRQTINIVFYTLMDGIFLYQSTDGGSTFVPTNQITPAYSVTSNPAIAIDATGNIGVVWTQEDNVYFRRSTDGGTTFGSPIRVNDAPAQVRPRIGAYGSVFFITWQSGDNRIVFDRTLDGTTFGADVQVSPTDGSHGDPVMAVDETGKIHIAWRRIGVSNIWYANSVDSGRTFLQHQRVSTEEISYRPTIAAYGGYVYVVWEDYRNIYTDIYCAVSSNGGISFGSSVRVNDNTNNTTQDLPDIALGSSSDAYVVWRDERTYEMNQDIYFARSTNAGQSFQINQRVNSTSGTPNYGHTRPAITAVGSTVFTVWSGTNGTGSTRLIYFSKASFKPGVSTFVLEEPKLVPAGFALHQNYPNPFNATTTIRYELPTQSYVRIVIYNVLGQTVEELLNTEQQAGYQSVVWKANVSSGLYFYRIEATSVENSDKRFVDIKKMLLLK